MFFRLRNHLHYAYFRFRTRKIYATPPLSCDPSAACEIHTMLGSRDLPLYLVGIKSLLRYVQSLAVIVHSDGTLDKKCENLLHQHVPGCKVIHASQADDFAQRTLGQDSFLWGCRNLDVCYRRLIDTELWSATKKRIVMDSDILVLNRPDQLLEWMEQGEGAFLLGQLHKEQGPVGVLPKNPHFQTIFKHRLKEISAALGLPARFLHGTTAGFYGCTDQLTLAKLEPVIRFCLQEKLPIQHWGSDQCLVIYLLSIAGAIHFDEECYFNFWPGWEQKTAKAHLVHFLGTARFYKHLYTRLATEVVRSLIQDPRVEGLRVGPGFSARV